MPTSPIAVSEALFSGRPSVRACVLLARYFRIQWREFHETFADDVVEAREERTRF